MRATGINYSTVGYAISLVICGSKCIFQLYVLSHDIFFMLYFVVENLLKHKVNLF